MGFLTDIAEVSGTVIGTACGLIAAPIAIALGVSRDMVQKAIDSGCTTVDEIKEFLEIK